MIDQNKTKPPFLVINDTIYSGSDIEIYATISSWIYDVTTPTQLSPYALYDSPGIVKLNTLHTLSYSVYRDKEVVRTLGTHIPAGFTRGAVTFAGTMIFTVGRDKVLSELFKYIATENTNDNTPLPSQFMRLDQLPPIDIFITYNNETGQSSRMAIYGIEFMNEGQVHSVSDLVTENSVNYLARFISPMRQVTEQVQVGQTTSSDIGVKLLTEDYENARKQIELMRKLML